MVLFYILLLIPLTTATRRSDVPSYRSNIMEGDKPILRMAPDADDEESNNSGEDKDPSQTTETKAPASAKDMSRLVNWLIDNFSYDLVAMGRKNNDGLWEGDKPILTDASNETEESEADHDEDIVIQKFEVMESEPTTESPVDPAVDTPVDPAVDTSVDPVVDTPVDPVVDTPVDPPVDTQVDPSMETPVASKETGLRTHKNKKKKKEKADPQWMTDLKDFIKDLTTRYGQHEVLDKTKPVIASLQKKHHMKIKDIDVDEYGEIHISYLDKGKGKKAARHSKKSEDR